MAGIDGSANQEDLRLVRGVLSKLPHEDLEALHGLFFEHRYYYNRDNFGFLIHEAVEGIVVGNQIAHNKGNKR